MSTLSETSRLDGGVHHENLPKGWYQVAWSHELAPGDVRPVKYFGTELVVFRTESGQIAVLDAYCKHLGAHLGYGGLVQGECIACPFHGWTWATDGHNVEIPYAKRPMKLSMGSWHVRECNGAVLAWYDHQGRDPVWEPEPIAEFNSEDYYAIGGEAVTHTWENVRLQPQYVIENAADFAHFKYVHKNETIGEILDLHIEGHRFYTDFGTNYRTPQFGVVPGRIPSIWYGPGLLYFRIEGVHDTAELLSVTPIDDTHSDMRVSLVAQRPAADATDAEREMAMRIMKHQVKEIDRDLLIWSHMRYQPSPPKPPLVGQENETFKAVREWTAQFYE